MKLQDITGIAPERRTYKGHPDLVLPTCYVGVELEYENFRVHEDLEFWHVKDDPSLRNHGAEFVTEPVFGHDLINSLNEMDAYLKNSGKKIQATHRCGVHVHVDAREIEVDDLHRWVIYGCIFERLLFRFCGRGREANIFCLPFHNSETVVQRLARFKENPVGVSIGTAVKYNGMNIRPLRELGTIEFRMLEGTRDMRRLLQWINILMCLKKVAVENKCSPEDIAGNLSAFGPLEFTKMVFGKYTKDLIYKGFEEDLYDGVRLSQDILYGGNLRDSDDELLGSNKFSEEFKKLMPKKNKKADWMKDHAELMDNPFLAV